MEVLNDKTSVVHPGIAAGHRGSRLRKLHLLIAAASIAANGENDNGQNVV